MTVKLSKNGKRLGRPPKNKNSGIVFVSPEPTIKKDEEVFVQIPEDASSVIECELKEVSQYFHVPSEEKKHGRYMTSIYSVDGFGKNRWVVGAYLKADWNKYKILKWHESEIIKRCVNYLNSLTISKKGKKKYGNLELYRFNKINKFGEELAVVELIIDERKNEYFWGEGERM